MESVLLARHGESEASARGLVNGDPSKPIGLSPRGYREARRLAEALREERIDLCVVTPFLRTVETAEIALAGRDVPRAVIAEMGDPPFGRFEGRHIDEFRAWLEHDGPTASLGGERRVDTVRRFARAYRGLLSRPESAILVIAHGLPVTYAVRAARGDSLPLTLEGAQVEHAVLHRLSAGDVRTAISAMETWADRYDPPPRAAREAAS